MKKPDKPKKQIELFHEEIYEHKDKRVRISFYTIFTIFIIFAGTLGTALSYAFTTDARHQISATLREIQEQKETNNSLRAENAQRYTLDEVARTAADKMGMNRPDPSQIIYINVPKQSHVVLHTGIQEEPERENYFWRRVRAFFEQFIG
jgi:cell division protein FtsL